MRCWIMLLSLGVATTLLSVSSRADDADAFLSGSARNCIECDLSGRDLKERDFKRARLDRAAGLARGCSPS